MPAGEAAEEWCWKKSVELGSFDRQGDRFRNILMAATIVTLTVHILNSDRDKPEMVMKKHNAA